MDWHAPQRSALNFQFQQRGRNNMKREPIQIGTETRKLKVTFNAPETIEECLTLVKDKKAQYAIFMRGLRIKLQAATRPLVAEAPDKKWNTPEFLAVLQNDVDTFDFSAAVIRKAPSKVVTLPKNASAKDLLAALAAQGFTINIDSEKDVK